MKRPVIYIDKKCYEVLIDHMNLQHTIDKEGGYIDLNLFYSDEWLLDSAVIENVSERNGNWDVYLVFAWVLNPMKLIKRKITRCITLSKAELYANYMRRLAAKDQRGTLQVDGKNFRNCLN